MELQLQFGHGMMSLSEELIEFWEGGVVILSPRDLTHEQMVRFSGKIEPINGKVVIDPQFYIPKSDHGRLISHSFWPDDYQTAFFNKVEMRAMLETLKNDYNDPLNSEYFILPGLMSTDINNDWFNYNEQLIEEAKKLISDKEIYLTICLSKEAMTNEESVHQIIEYLDTWNIDGCYVVAEPPSNEYLITDPNWLVNLLDLTTGIKHQNKKVIVGYSNHQMLILALSKVDAIASGNWLNVRTFNTSRFNNPEDSMSRRSKWYYCPQALSEYQINFLDLANRVGVLQDLKTDSSFGSTFADLVFTSGAQPSTVNYNERSSFQHYLHCLRHQASLATKNSYSLTKEGIKMQLETARMITERLSNNGIVGRARDFGNVVDYNLSAVAVYDNLRGLVQNNNWNQI